MLTTIVDVRPEPMALAATLAPLVRGVVEGMVGSAWLVATQEDRDVADIADSAGCRLIIVETWREGFARVVANASGSGLILIDTGLQLGPDFWPILADRLPFLGDRPAATEPAGGGFNALLGRAFGRANRDCALLLPQRRAREIARERLDPFAIRYGKSLSWIRASTTRVRISEPKTAI